MRRTRRPGGTARSSRPRLLDVTEMNTLLRRLASLGLLFTLLTFAACSNSASESEPAPVSVPAAAAIESDDAATDSAIRFLEQKAREDEQDFVARNKLVGYYLQKVRDTGSVRYLELADRAARESLASVPAEQNVGGLAGLTQVEFASHAFESARSNADRWRALEPGKLGPLLVLYDVLVELGDDAAANEVFHEIEGRSAASDRAALDVAVRRAKQSMLKGDVEKARHQYELALVAAGEIEPAPRETIAWCRVQLAETAIAVGDYAAALGHADDALVVFPGYFRALAARARSLAASGDLAGAIAEYEHVTRVVPDPSFIASLGDCYAAAGRDADANAQYAIVEKIGKLSAFNGVLYNRQLAVFRADHGRDLELAYTDAAREYKLRRDVYGADALAWTAFKTGRVAEAQTAMRDALRLGTRDARMFAHAGEIALAAGDTAGAKSYFERSLALSPAFDPLAAPRVREKLASLTTAG